MNRQLKERTEGRISFWLCGWFCVDHPFLLHHALTLCFTMRLFFCSFYPCSAAAGRQENQGLSLCLHHMPCAQHRVTCVLCIFRHLAVPLHLCNLWSSKRVISSSVSFSCEPSYFPRKTPLNYKEWFVSFSCSNTPVPVKWGLFHWIWKKKVFPSLWVLIGPIFWTQIGFLLLEGKFEPHLICDRNLAHNQKTQWDIIRLI